MVDVNVRQNSGIEPGFTPILYQTLRKPVVLLVHSIVQGVQVVLRPSCSTVRSESHPFYFHDRMSGEKIFLKQFWILYTFVYFGIRYIFWQSIKMYPIQFLNIYLKSLAVCSLLVFYSFQVETREYYFVLFFFVVAIILHFASRPEIRRYFRHK